MKKILVMLLFSFSVIAYASPPPDLTPSIIADNVQLVVQAEVQNIQPAVQEVAFNYLGNFEFATCYAEFGLKQVNDVVVPEATVTDVSYLQLSELNKPPAFNRNQQVLNFNPDKQNSNYGYPFGADYVS